MTCVADVETERIQWLWPGRLPAGKAVVLDGDPGLGKSTLTLDLTARVTTGAPMPDGTEPLKGPSPVVILSAEDGVADTIRPRLDALGANVALVHVFTGVLDVDAVERPPSLPDDLAHLEAVIRDTAAVLVVIDPLMAYLGGAVDSHRDQDVRTAMHPLARIAERTGACFVLVRHLNKTNGTRALYRGGGSIAIVGAARVGLLAAADPDDPDSRRILAVTKSNLAAHPPALAYRLVAHDALDVPTVKWEGATDHRADDLVATPVDDEERSALDDACEVLLDILDDGPLLAATARKDALAAGVSERTLKRAKAKLGVKSTKVGKPGEKGEWWWEPPARRRPENPEGVHTNSWNSTGDSGPLRLGDTGAEVPA